VCKNVLNDEKIIPIFGRGTDTSTDPRLHPHVPHRPAPPPREEAPPPPRFPLQGNLFGMNFSAGFFGPGMVGFGGTFGGAGGGGGLPELSPEQRRQQQFLSQVMLFIGFAVLTSLLLT
jgi:hypothetical protein